MYLDLDKGWTAEELEYANNTSGVYILCKTCQDKERKREAAVTVQPNTRCAHRSYPGGPYSELFVVSADGDQVTVGVLGLGTYTDERQDEVTARFWPTIMQGRRVFCRYDLLMKGL
jgi:hypothetical protein